MRLTLACVSICAAAFAGCRSPEPAADGPATELRLTARQGSLEGPDTLYAGWTPFTVNEVAGSHVVVLFRVSETMSQADLASFVATLDTARATPTAATALGGPEVDSVTVIVGLPVGRYVVACMTRDRQDRRHATVGEVRFVEVVDSGGSRSRDSANARIEPPIATQHVSMTDFAYTGSESWSAGPNVLRVTNDGKQDHLLLLARLRPGVTTRAWLESDKPNALVIKHVTGVARTGPGQEAYLPVNLETGEYVLYCLIPDAASGKMHIELGMFRGIHVQ